jgi:DNA-binding MarR family transcriptional regulator
MQATINLSTRGRQQPGLLAWLRLARVFQKVDRRTANHVRPYGLTVAQFDVLAQVGAREGLTQQELADALFVTKGNVCQLLDRMERRGLLERRPARTGRGNHLYLTDEGRRLAADVVPAQEALIERCFAGLAADEQMALLGLLKRLDRSVDQEGDNE